MFMFGWDFEVDTCSRFWRWNMIKICVRTCKLNSTLGSIVPLAMFIIFHYLILPTSGKHILCSSPLPEKGRNTFGSEQACQVAVYIYYGLCWCWVGASLPGWSIHHQSWEGSPNCTKTFIIATNHIMHRRGRRWRGASRTRGSSIEVVRDLSGDSSLSQDIFWLKTHEFLDALASLDFKLSVSG